MAFEEADSIMAATQLFADYQPGDKVAIISRFQDNTDKFIKALKDIKGIEARYIKGQTGPQDFCFLLKAQKEIVVSARSTFGRWAGYLGDMERARMYSLSTKESRALGMDYCLNKFERKDVRDRLIFENYNKTDHANANGTVSKAGK